MRLAITEKFIEDLACLPKDISKKCRTLLRELRAADPKRMLERGLPGWRLHKLQSSPFRSASVDMQYRMLLKIESETLFIHRVVKHAAADTPAVNRNDTASEFCEISPVSLRAGEIWGALQALGLNAREEAFKQVNNEDDLLTALQGLPPEWGQLALDLYELNDINIKLAKYKIIAPDDSLDQALASTGENWQIYLHPSQTYVAQLPQDARFVIYGSAGTGKTICAWHRIATLARGGAKVGFACPSNVALEVSRAALSRILEGVESDCFFLVPQNSAELVEMAAATDHLVIDEGQEFRPSWYSHLATVEGIRNRGVTVFADLNQILGTVPAKSSERRERCRALVEEWQATMRGVLRCIPLSLTINYRNSAEIAAFYFDLLSRSLLIGINAEAPVFSAGEVVRCQASSVENAALTAKHFLTQLKTDVENHEVAIISLLGGGARRVLLDTIGRQSNFWTEDDDDLVPASGCKAHKLVFSHVNDIRGYERKVVIALVRPVPNVIDNPKHAIEAYIALSRAREVLILIEVTG